MGVTCVVDWSFVLFLRALLWGGGRVVPQDFLGERDGDGCVEEAAEKELEVLLSSHIILWDAK